MGGWGFRAPFFFFFCTKGLIAITYTEINARTRDFLGGIVEGNSVGFYVGFLLWLD